jgi:tripartite-type tricarboxylate transporter receptor subunit TctC
MAKKLALLIAGLVAAVIVSFAAGAADYPTRPITLIVPHKAGGPSDVIARVLGGMLANVLRQSLVIENRPGAAGTIAAEQAALARPDGYTLLLGNTAMLATAGKSVDFDLQLDFAPITLLGTQANVLVVNPELPAYSLQQLIEIAKARHRGLTFASAGHGSAAHLAAELFKTQAQVDMVHVPYKKPGPALQDVVGGHVQIMFAPAALVAGHVRAGRVRALGIASVARSPLLPAIATIDELALPGFDATTWYGLVAPVGTPKDVIDLLYHSTAAVLDDPNARKIMGNLGVDVVAGTPRAFEAHIKGQIPKWAAVIKSIAAYTH